jgi:Protein of unknown function (DUF3263)
VVWRPPQVRAASAAAARLGHVAASPSTYAAGLDERTRWVLDFERTWWRQGGSKERGIRERFGVSTTRYHQLLMRAIERPEALGYDPVLVRRLRRLRDDRRRRRLARRLGLPS